MLDVTETQGYK